ncbi:WSC-domain-containing protein [Lepidopterella palustris CBS 459.81]|uniref:WSC-domain-containing protein n=1 Tax=Lepidopterella palustris CBS 459.81 TaxID=1314670 RepID=A0A8E2E8P2_9PEZI|nr:WSC-domain-containing protein [Lepidopterella palustris CBS 459.81]
MAYCRFNSSSVQATLLFFLSFFFTARVNSLGDTDTITWGGDVSRSGYQTNHNLDPTVVASANFGQIFKTLLPGNFNGIGPEQVFSQPLVYTGSDGIQYVYVATTQNNVYKLDAKTGAIIASRNLHVPFLTADLDGCVDINPTVGVTATGVIDPSTGIWYLTAKTYSTAFQNGLFSPAKPPGRLNGRYYQHAIHTEDLSEADNFPVMLDGIIFRNNPNRMFIGGNQHSRPAALQVGDFIYTGFASHCVQYNFTGAIIGFHRTTGAVVEAFATEGGPEDNSIKGGGVWMSGGGLAYDGKGSMYFATGNGYASQLPPTGNSIQGRNPPSALEEAAVNAKINDDGTLTIVDFFMPWEKTQLDGADKDLGTSPLELLPTDVFTCPNHKRIGVVTGKSGKTYWLNLDNLGGYQTGPNKLDAAIQVTQNENSVYAGAGVMPLGGGYIYINVIQYQTHAFKFSCDSSGNAVFTHVADTPEKNAFILGVGHGTTTSLGGQEGTGLLWTSDVEGENLRIYDPIPPASGGNLTLLNAFNIPGVTKFTRPVFGNARVYMGTTTGYFYGFGSPVNLPLNCSAPYQFGTVPVGNTSAPMTINCVANIGTTITGVALSGNLNFVVSNVPITPLTLTAGQNLTFTAVFRPKSVGPLSSDIIVNTTNAVTGYSVNTPITLKGTANSVAPLLAISPNTVSFNIVAGQGSATASSIFSNRGDSLLTFQHISYSLVSETGPWITPNISSDGTVQVGVFNFTNIPATIPGDSSSTVTITYAPLTAGNHAVFVNASSNGGNAILDVIGVAGTSPVALVEFQTPDGSGWVPFSNNTAFTFGTVLEGQTKYLKLRVTNNGSANAVPLSLTVSKPPYGVTGIVGAVNDIDLTEGTILQAGQNATATLYCAVPKSQVNMPSYNGSATWTMNTGDPNMGKQYFQFLCNAATEQVGPLLPNGTAQYEYVGCFKENNPGRQMATSPYADANNTNDRCIATCYGLGYTFAATQYQQECWCGNAIPIQMDTDADCNYQCTGNVNETCGGNGYFHNAAHMSVFADSTKFNGNTTSNPLAITNSVGNYNYVGCYSENGAKTLSTKTTSTNSMTVEACAVFCSAYPYFGLEYSAECYCGSTLSTLSTLTTDDQCSMTCKGSNSEYCGAGGKMQIYQANGTAPSSTSTSLVASTVASSSTVSTSAATTGSLTGYISLGCYNETHDRRALNGAGRAGTPTNTLESCAAFCSGFAYFGVEYGAECYCGQSIYVNSIKQADQSGCNMPCAGNSAETCGGSDFLNMWYTNNTVTSTFTTATASTTAPITTMTGPVVVASVGNYLSIGCYNEVPNGRALTVKSVANNSMTVELCAAFCSGTTYFGVEYGAECYCGNTIPSTSALVTDGRCSMTCANNTKEICGGPSGLSMYQVNVNASSISSVASPSSSTASSSPSISGSATVSNSSTISSTSTVSSSSTALTSVSSTVSSSASSSISTLSPTVTSVPSTVGSFVSLGCYSEKSGGRALSTAYYNDSMTIELCAAQADAAGWVYFGVEYGRECWMGEILDSALPTAQSNCNMKCPGNSMEWCGAGNYLQLYNYSSTLTRSSSSSAFSSTSSVSSSASSSLSVSSSVSSSASSSASSTTSSSISSSASSAVSSFVSSSVSSSALSTASSPVSSSSSSSTFSSASSTIPSTTSASASPTPLNCPTSNNTIYTSPAGSHYRIECFVDRGGNDLGMQYTASLETCLAACDALAGCKDVSFVAGGGACYMKSAAGSPGTNTGVWGAVFVPAISSSSSIASASSLSSSVSVPASTTSSASLTASSSVSSSSSSSIFSSVSSTVSSATSASATPTPLNCPTSNSTVYTSPAGSHYRIECFVDRGGNDLGMQYTVSFEACLAACDALAGCKDVSFVAGGGACYMKSAAGSPGTNSGVWGAVFVPAISSSSSVTSTSSLSSSVSVPASATRSSSSSTASSMTSSAFSTVTSSSSASSTISSSSSITRSSSSMTSSTSPSTPSSSSSVSSSSSSSSSSLASSSSSVSSSMSSAGIYSIPTLTSSYSTMTTLTPSTTSTTSFSSASSTLVSSSSSSKSTSSSSSSTQTLSASSSSTSTSSFTSSSFTSSATPTGPTAVPTVGSYKYQGCYTEATSGRSLSALTTANSTSMTPAMCAAFCSQYAWFGVEYGQECYCGPYPQSTSILATPQTSCNMVCPGDGTALCGAGNRLQMYYSSDPTKVSKDPAVLPSAGNYTYYNCVVDTANPRALGQVLASDGMSVESCLQQAELRGFQWAGIEYGRECWMGSTLASNAVNATAASQCNMNCKGAPGELCGAGSRITLYKRNAGV